MKAIKMLRIVIVILLALAVVGLLCWQAFVEKNLETKDLLRAVLILAGLVLALLKTRRRVSNPKALYQKAYGQFIQNAFSNNPKLEKKFYSAVDLYNQNKSAAALHKLNSLRKECQRSADLYAVTVFTALCCDDMGVYEEAIGHYYAALQIRPHSTLASNMGLCYQKSGDTEKAMEAYQQAVRIDPSNAYAHNNISALYFRDGDYESALDYAEAALDLDGQMAVALGTAAICHALLGNTEAYQMYYRKAVSAGYSGQKIKNTIRSLDPNI